MSEQETRPGTGTLTQRLVAASADTPYDVQPTPTGFVVRLDLADERWWELMHRYDVRRAFVIDARVDEESGTVETTTTLFGVAWQSGAQGREVPVVATAGTVLEKEFGHEGRVVEFGDADNGAIHSCSAVEAAGWIWREVTGAGLTKKRTTAQKIGFVVAVVAAVIGGLGAIAVLVGLLVTRVF
ncbi:MAG: hypothetical protein GEV10_01120 [Streptosporangiales bacterium]|nr:hypothetical protein [Streptosporangiales bacterium]